MKKGAIFDQDGLMFDTEAIFSLAWAQAAKQLNVKLPEGFRTAVSGSSGEGTRQIIRTFVPDADPDTLMKLTFQISYGIQSHTLPEKPGLHEILEFFRAQGVKMAVASSSSAKTASCPFREGSSTLTPMPAKNTGVSSR